MFNIRNILNVIIYYIHVKLDGARIWLLHVGQITNTLQVLNFNPTGSAKLYWLHYNFLVSGLLDDVILF